jgi:hypothetical protein
MLMLGAFLSAPHGVLFFRLLSFARPSSKPAHPIRRYVAVLGGDLLPVDHAVGTWLLWFTERPQRAFDWVWLALTNAISASTLVGVLGSALREPAIRMPMRRLSPPRVDRVT